MGERVMGSTATLVAPRRPDREAPRASRSWDLAAPVDLAAATAFLRMYHAEQGGPGRWERHRLAEVRAEIERTGTYTHTREELVFGTRVAWREANRSVGREYWLGIEVRDMRHVSGPEGIFAEVVNHLELTSQRGRYPIRPVISIFSPSVPHQPVTRIWNRRLVARAGYQRPNGTMAGDRHTVEFTRTVLAYGWEAGDVLPLVVDSPRDGVRLFDLPERARIPVKTVANLRLCIGGISYPLAPFNVAGDDRENGGVRMPGTMCGRPRFRLDPLAETLARYGRAPVVPGVISLPRIPDLPLAESA
jgi:nitric-oxide synthase